MSNYTTELDALNAVIAGAGNSDQFNTVVSSSSLPSGAATDASLQTIIANQTNGTQVASPFEATTTLTIPSPGNTSDIDVTGMNALRVQLVNLTGISAQVLTRASTDGTNFSDINIYGDVSLINDIGMFTDGTFTMNVSGLKKVRFVSSGLTATLTLIAKTSTGQSPISHLLGGIVQSQQFGAWSVTDPNLGLSQASTTSGQKGPLVQGAATTNAPSYTTAKTNPLSLDTSGNLRVSLKDSPANTNKFLVTADPVTFASPQHIIADSGTISTITNVVHVDDNSGSLTVDNNGTFAVQATLAAETTKVIGTVNVAASQTIGIASGSAQIGHLEANQSCNVSQINGVTPLMGAGNGGTGSLRVNVASDQVSIPVAATLQTGSAQIGHLEANQSVNTAQINGVTPLMGNGVTGTGSQRVTIASDNTAFSVNATLQTGSNQIGHLEANQSVNNAQVAGSNIVASVTGVQDVMPRKRTGSTGLAPNYSASHITTKTTTTPTSSTAYVSAIVISCSNAGTSSTMIIRDKQATPLILVPSFTLTVPSTGLPIILQFAEPIVMTSGIDIVTGGTTMGVADVWITYWQ